MPLTTKKRPASKAKPEPAPSSLAVQSLARILHTTCEDTGMTFEHTAHDHEANINRALSKAKHSDLDALIGLTYYGD